MAPRRPASAKPSRRPRRATLTGCAKTPREFVLSEQCPALALVARSGSDTTVLVRVAARAVAGRMLEVDLEPHAALAVSFVWDGKPCIHIAQHFRVGRGARLHILNKTSGSCVQETVSEVTGAGGESRIDWSVHATGRTKCTLSVQNHFLAPKGRGDLTIYGVAEDHAAITCNGDVTIGPRAAGTQAHLTEKILVLDPTARADAVPSLDVQTHDVQASHSASVSRIHPEDLFYLASRGIAQKKARKLFVEGFLQALLPAITPEESASGREE